MLAFLTKTFWKKTTQAKLTGGDVDVVVAADVSVGGEAGVRRRRHRVLPHAPATRHDRLEGERVDVDPAARSRQLGRSAVADPDHLLVQVAHLVEDAGHPRVRFGDHRHLWSPAVVLLTTCSPFISKKYQIELNNSEH